MSTVISIERFDGGLLELDGWGLASTFFTIDPSSVGMRSYDQAQVDLFLDEAEAALVDLRNPRPVTEEPRPQGPRKWFGRGWSSRSHAATLLPRYCCSLRSTSR